MVLWSENSKTHPAVETFTVGDDHLIDSALVEYDCRASKTHARMLERTGILTEREARDIIAGLNEIVGLHRDGQFTIERRQEDCHTAIEEYLTEKLGDTAKKLHTGRSRNDQVLTALRLLYREKAAGIDARIKSYSASLRRFIRKYGAAGLPGYTHTRKAMPSSVSLWAGAYRESMRDNRRLFRHIAAHIDQSPLGSGAGYGVPVDTDRDFTADDLGFRKVQRNPLYVQLSRGKFEALLLSACLPILFDLNRFAADVILFSTPEFGFFTLSETICTGSSIMPQKRNPDVFELLRARYHEVLAAQMEVGAIPAGLISGYSRDLQLLKRPVLRSLDTVSESLEAAAAAVSGIGVDRRRCRESMTGELYAAERAFELVKEGVPFRDAYLRISGEYM